jgi:hypothetical protein
MVGQSLTMIKAGTKKLPLRFGKRRPFLLLQLIRASLMIAALEHSVLDDRKRPQRLDRAHHDHAFVFSSSCDLRSSCLSIASPRFLSKFSGPCSATIVRNVAAT